MLGIRKYFCKFTVLNFPCFMFFASDHTADLNKIFIRKLLILSLKEEIELINFLSLNLYAVQLFY